MKKFTKSGARIPLSYKKEPPATVQEHMAVTVKCEKNS